MNYQSKKEAVEFLKRILYIERKTELVRGINLETHKVIDMWERMNFLDREAFRIAASLNKRRKLMDIANDMERRLSIDAIKDDSQKQVGVDTTLYSFTVLTQMVRSGEKLLNDLILFLTLCPNGLDLTEINILLNKFPSQLSKEEKEEKIKLYIDLFREASTIGEGEQQNTEHSPTKDANESFEKLENLREIIHHLLFFEIEEEPISSIRVKLSANDRPALEFIVSQNAHINEKIANIGSSEIFECALNFFLPYAKYLLFKIRD